MVEQILPNKEAAEQDCMQDIHTVEKLHMGENPVVQNTERASGFQMDPLLHGLTTSRRVSPRPTSALSYWKSSLWGLGPCTAFSLEGIKSEVFLQRVS